MLSQGKRAVTMRPNHRARAFEEQRQDLGVVHRETKGTVPCIAQLIVPGQYSPGKLKRHQWYRREGKKNMSWALGKSVDPRRPDVVKAFKNVHYGCIVLQSLATGIISLQSQYASPQLLVESASALQQHSRDRQWAAKGRNVGQWQPSHKWREDHHYEWRISLSTSTCA
jgi:hypothetical protein